MPLFCHRSLITHGANGSLLPPKCGANWSLLPPECDALSKACDALSKSSSTNFSTQDAKRLDLLLNWDNPQFKDCPQLIFYDFYSLDANLPGPVLMGGEPVMQGKQNQTCGGWLCSTALCA
jgi:hypothetical protein